MNTIEFTRPGGAAAGRPSARRNVPAGPQGEALILELRTAKATLDRHRRERLGSEAPPPLVPSASPERMLHQSPNSGEQLDRHRRERLRNEAPPPLAPSASPERMLHQFPSLGEQLDRLDRSLPQEQLPPADNEGELRASHSAAEKAAITPILRAGVQTLRTYLEWLVSGGRETVASGESFAEQIIRTHDRQLKAASRVLTISVAVAGSWVTLVPLSGAVVLPGKLVVESSVKKIQHPSGGVVAAIPVQDGMHVDAGTLLVRLDETQVRANEQLVANQLDQVRARIARLIGEREGSNGLQLSKALADRSGDPSVAQLVAAETALFNARANARNGQKQLYQSNISQFEKQIDGLNAEIESKTAQIGLIASELTGIQELYTKGLVPLTRLTTLQRDSARLEGERAELTATIAATKAKIGQAQLQITQIDQDFRSEVMKDLREAQDKEAELTERNVAAKDQLDRTEIRAPTPGVVHELAVHTIGGVIRPGDVIMQIVPDADALEIEAHLPPNEIDQVEVNQRAYLRFSTLDRPTMPEVAGTVTYVSADLSHDEQSNANFYTVKIDLPSGERHRLDGMTLVSGMPVEIFLQTGSRTMLRYLLKPITDQFHRMFNEP
ncbi:MAG TPA: HlyD family type I secretion periplasmic adaptor subunit [Xanthobacteraceae bacterium]